MARTRVVGIPLATGIVALALIAMATTLIGPQESGWVNDEPAMSGSPGATGGDGLREVTFEVTRADDRTMNTFVAWTMGPEVDSRTTHSQRGFIITRRLAPGAPIKLVATVQSMDGASITCRLLDNTTLVWEVTNQRVCSYPPLP